MSNDELNISLGRTKTKLPFDKNITNENSINNIITELNLEYNKLLNNMGRMNETIMLFFLLFKIESCILKNELDNFDNFFIQILSNLKNFIQSKKDDDIKEILGLNQKLVVIIVYKKIELLTMQNSLFEEKNGKNQNIENFIENIEQEIKRIENNILLL